MPNKYSTFRNRTLINSDVVAQKTVAFIENSASSVEALRESTGTNIKAVIISERKEGADETILFSYADDDLSIGEYVTYKNKTYLIYSEYDIMFTDGFKKHKLIECNITLKWNGNIQKAYYISSLRKYSSVSDLGNGNIPYEFSSQKPIVITAQNSALKPGIRFIVGGDAFIIEDLDKLSNAGIYYMSVSESNIIEGVDDQDNSETFEVPAAEITVLTGELVAGEEETISTYSGYATFDKDVDVISKTLTEITFEVPIGVSSLIVNTKDELGNIIINEYKVVV